VALVGTGVSKERSASIIKATRIGELGTLSLTSKSSVRRLLVTANVVASPAIIVALMMEAIHIYGTLVLTRATRRNIREDGILSSHLFHSRVYLVGTRATHDTT
jgi:hypothetical protein